MKLRNIVFGLVAASLFAGCSMFERKPVDYKAGAVETPSLEVPPDLTAPESEQRYVIPGTDGEKVASYSDYTKKKTEQPCVNPASAPAAASPAAAKPAPAATAAAASAKLQVSNGIQSILLGEPFDRSWRRVGLALDSAHFVTTDKDRSKGIYFVAAADKDNKKLPDYQVMVRDDGADTVVTVVDQHGKSDADTARLVRVLFQSLDKSNRGDAILPPR